MSKYRKYFKGDEWAYFLRLGAALHDPEAKREFWNTVIEKKQASTLYSVYDDFPKEGRNLETCQEIIAMLKAKNSAQTEEEKKWAPPKNQELENFGALLGELIERGEHLPKDEKGATA